MLKRPDSLPSPPCADTSSSGRSPTDGSRPTSPRVGEGCLWSCRSQNDDEARGMTKRGSIGSVRRVRLERPPTAQPRLAEALDAVARTLAAWRPEAPISFAGDPLRPFDPSPDEITAELAAWRAAERTGELRIFRMTSAPPKHEVTLFLGHDRFVGAPDIEHLLIPV